MRKWIALLLALVMTVLMAPTAFAFGGSAQTTDVWTEIERIEENAAKGADSITAEARAQAYAGAVDQIEAAVKASADYVPGSLVRNGDFLFWDTTDGTGCGYSPRLRARIAETAIPNADPEAYSGIVTHSYGTRGGSAGSMNVAAFQPYYGIDSSFTTQYKTECESIAQATGGTATTYLTTNATIDNIANAIETCGVVIFDSHGDTDYASGYDYTSRANTSYLCLQSGTGITDADMVTVQGTYGTYKHAYYGGSYGSMQYYMVDGTAISNHMDQNSPNGLLWMAICLGMATDGLQAPLHAKGVEVVYGYSQSVTFTGDYKYEENFWSKMKSGDDVKTAIAYMKQKVGIKDPYTSSYPAYPIVVSSEDVYPGHGNVDKAQTVNSTWTLFTQYEVTALTNNDAWGTVSVSGNTITATPAEGYYAAGYEVVSGTATVTQNGNVFQIAPSTDCTIQINFAAKTPAQLHFSVPEGLSCAPIDSYIGDAVILPAPEGTLPETEREYTFLGWTSAPVVEDVDEYPGVFRAGTALTLTEASQTLYALYSYVVAEEGGPSDCFQLVSEEPATWTSEWVITYNGTKALDASGTVTGTAIGGTNGVIDLSAAGVAETNGVLMNVPDELVYQVIPAEDDTYAIKMKNSDYYLALLSNSNSLSTATSVSEKSRWTIAMGANGPTLTSVAYPERSLQYNTSSNMFRAYKGTQQPLSIYASISGTTWYTTNPTDSEPEPPALTIVTQPQDVTAEPGTIATIAVEAEGDGLTYQWQVNPAGSAKWVNSTVASGTKAALKVSATAARDGYRYRCVITDAYDNQVISEVATLHVMVPLAITTQPQDVTAEPGTIATISVAATGTGLSYQWQVKPAGSAKWVNSTVASGTKATLKVSATAARDGYQYRCIITDASGSEVISEIATLHVNVPLEITAQPQNVTAADGTIARFTVAANGNGLTYQWQVNPAGSAKWVNSTAASGKTAVLKVSATAARNGYQYRCIITDANGEVVISQAAMLIVQ